MGDGDPSRWRRRRRQAWLLAGLAWSSIGAVGGCAGQHRRGTARRPLLALFEVRPRKVRLPRRLLVALQDHAIRLIDLAGGYRAVPHSQLRAQLGRRRLRSERSCRDLRCQARLGPRLFRAHKSLAVEVNQRMLAQCEVVATIYDLDQRSIDHHARATTSCNGEDLVRALSRVVCHLSRVHREGAAPVGIVVSRRGRRRTKVPTPPPAQAAPRCLASGELTWLDGQLDVWSRSPRRGEDQAEAAERAIEFRRAYEQLGRSHFAPVAVAARCRTGTVYDRLADRLSGVTGRVPAAVRRLGREAVARHQQEQAAAQSRRAAPFRVQARKLYRQCLERAEALGVGGRHVEEARSRLSALGQLVIEGR